MTGEEQVNTGERLRASDVPHSDFNRYTKAPVTIEAALMEEEFVVETMENKRGEKLYGSPGDYLIRGVEGELYPCAASVFEQTYIKDCKCDMHKFHFKRIEDESGTSGTGIVAEGVEFSDGSVMIHWFNEDNPDTDTTNDGFSFKPGPDGVGDSRKVHGHGGLTQIVFHDPDRSDLSE